MKKHKKSEIGHIMTPTPHSIGSDQKLSAAHHMMREYSIRHLPVLRGGGLVGVLSERDLYFLESMSGVDPEIDRVVDAMTPDVYTTTATAPIRDVAKAMAKHKYGCAVIMENGHVIGVFTITDALVHLADLLS